MKRFGALLACWLIILFPGAAAFAQTVITDVWKDKAYHSTVEKIAVLCIVPDPSRRLSFEAAFVRQMRDRGTDAVPVYVVIPPDKTVDTVTALTRIRELGADAILTLRLVDKSTIQTQIPDPATKGSTASSNWSGYYQSIRDSQKRKKDEPAYLETILFDTATEQRVWAARSVTKVVEVNQELITTFITSIVDQLASDKMIR
jgi:hypothetical protein